MLTISKPSVSVFPKFEALKPNLFNYYQDFIYEFPPHCDFSLNNLLIWFGDKSTRISQLNENLVLEINETTYSNQLGGSWFTILGNNKADESLETFWNSGLANELVMVPDYFIDSLNNPDGWVIKEDEDNRDYILSISSLLSKKGKLYENFRYQISYFLRHYSGDSRLQDLDLLNPNASSVITECLKSWHVNSFVDGANDSQRVDELAIHRLLELQNVLPIKHRCIGVYIDDKLAGFSIFHVPNSKYSIGLGNHIKFNGQYKRMFDFLIFATASRLNTEGIKYLNAEQDMGLPGIRHHKKYLNPETFYKKYTIEQL